MKTIILTLGTRHSLSMDWRASKQYSSLINLNSGPHDLNYLKIYPTAVVLSERGVYSDWLLEITRNDS